MSALSLTAPERARKIASTILQRMNEGETQAAMSVAIGVSAPTVNRMLSEHLDKFAAIVAHLGFKCVDQDMRCVSKETYDFLTTTHQRVMKQAPQLIWDTEE